MGVTQSTWGLPPWPSPGSLPSSSPSHGLPWSSPPWGSASLPFSVTTTLKLLVLKVAAGLVGLAVYEAGRSVATTCYLNKKKAPLKKKKKKKKKKNPLKKKKKKKKKKS